MSTRLKIVIGNDNLVRYPTGGGHWSWALQYLFGLVDLGHDVTWLEVVKPKGDSPLDPEAVGRFFTLMRQHGFDDRCIVVVQSPDGDEIYGATESRLRKVIAECDMLWNLALGIRQPLLSRFRHRVLIDVDPGHLQGSALHLQMPIADHSAWLTVGMKINDGDCTVPRLGVEWSPIRPFVHLPLWPARPRPALGSPITTVTHWNWGEDPEIDGRLYSTSKRLSYLRHVGLAPDSPVPLVLATQIDADDGTGDYDILRHHGWTIVNSSEVTQTPDTYREFIASSAAELCCPKGIYRELRTGWFSDRSVCYLATGRPVLMEDTGVGDHVPTGAGLITFTTFAEARDAIREVHSNHRSHARAARELAEEFFDARHVLNGMIDACN